MSPSHNTTTLPSTTHRSLLPTHPAVSKSSLSPFQKKQKMSLSQTYHLAHSARSKLSKEASRADHDLRLLVGHANLLDGLMLDLAEAEREQESWFNQSVRGASAADERHISWADNLPPTIVEDYEEDESSDSEVEYDDDEEDESEDEDMDEFSLPRRAARSPTPAVHVMEIDEDEDEDEDDDEDTEDEESDSERLQLTRSPSHSNSPPELLVESDSSDSDEDDSMPPSPPLRDSLDHLPTQPPQKQLHTIHHDLLQSPQEAFDEEGFYVPQRTAVAAY